MIRLDLYCELVALAERLPGQLCYDVEVTQEDLGKVGGPRHTRLDNEGNARDYVQAQKGRLVICAWGPKRPATEAEHARFRLRLVDAAVGTGVPS
jgi:hypothetical protein